MKRLLIYSLLAFSCWSLKAQTAPKPLVSYEVNADNTITLRYEAPKAAMVQLTIDGSAKPLPMIRDDQGVWSVTTPVLPPEIYNYSFVVDGVSMLDPRNVNVVPNLVFYSDNILVPGSAPEPWEKTDIPHGEVHEHLYTTHVALNMPHNQSSFYVYTPPGYDAHRKGGYPVLYLLHGWSDLASSWTASGRANLMMDSMIDSGKAVPMIVVMPLGYGDMSFVAHGFSAWEKPALVDQNEELFEQMLEREVMPSVEHEYNVAPGRKNRAIIGLSMGGLESLYTGLHHTDQFAWVGGMSSAIQQGKFAEHLPHLDAKKANLSLLWVACGTEDQLIAPNRSFVAWAKEQGLNVTAVETPGAHTWLVWRDNLLHFAPLLFRTK